MIDNRTNEQLVALYNISKALNSTLDVQVVLQTMLEMVLEIFQADAGSVMLERNGYLTIEVSQGLDPEIVAQTRQRLGTGIAGWVAATGQPLHLDGKVQDPRFKQLVERGDSIASSLSVPISVEGLVAGVVMIRRVGERTFANHDLAFLVSVGDLAAVALQKARLFQAERKQRNLLQFEHQKLRATLSSMADGVLVLDERGGLLMKNSVAEKFLLPLLGNDISLFGAKFGHLLERGETELEAGERLLKVVETPLLVGEKESGSVLVFRDETARRELERMKSEFLSMISHELKTPITTIGAFLELLLEREFPRQRETHFLNICADECGRLQTLIEQLLHLTRLESGRFAMEKSEQRLDRLLRDSVPPFVETNPRHSFVLKEPFPVARLCLDATLVIQAITNLLANAVKYSPEGGIVEIDLKEDAETFLISVSDQGVGIEAEKLKYVFEKFYRADNSLTRATGGTGLGLANVKHIALAHQGRTWATSEVGVGSVFFMELPKKCGDEDNA